MKRTNLNFLVDTLGFMAFVFLIATGVLLKYLLPPGSGRQNTIWGYDRHQWGDVHFWLAVGMVAVVAIHVYLHWVWIKVVVKGKSAQATGKRITFTLIFVAAVLVLALSPLLSPKVQSSSGGHGEGDEHGGRQASATEGNREEGGRGKQGALHVSGSMTLQELVEASGVPASHILDALGLPGDTDLQSRLGPLRREYGFEMETVRRIVSEYERRP
jgi:hypothetical protein